MIGVIADIADHDVVREFFELFKTPWEFCRANRHYDVLLCAGDGPLDGSAKLVVFYSSKKTTFDGDRNIAVVRPPSHTCILSYRGGRLPIYGDTITFSKNGNSLLTDEVSQECAGHLHTANDTTEARIGYDLFREIRTLLTVGQPPANASLPALELHIAFLRGLITDCGVQLVEIPPVPAGYRFVACLTHDVDHPSIRRHKLDHTTFGFLYRAVFGSLQNFVRGRLRAKDLFTNWWAALKLPLVHMGLARDFWLEFDDRYLKMEAGLRSTFFVIPFRNQPGRKFNGSAPKLRAARYGARDIADNIGKLTTAGCEVGLHGIDAWIDSSRGRNELDEIRRVTRGPEIGVRMHWLYCDQQSPVVLESAGAAYDSTIGYNETVGYRAGTTQAYKPLNADQLLEMPLHIMDTALFYPTYLNLTAQQATARLGEMLDNAAYFGGAVTVNWHDRSLAPERLWKDCYRDLLQDLQGRGAWFSTVGEAVSWFRKRRSASFEVDSTEPDGVRVKFSAPHGHDLPGLRLRIHKARNLDVTDVKSAEEYLDVAVDEIVETGISAGARR